MDQGKLTDPETLISIQAILATLRRSKIGLKLMLVDACRNDPSIKGSKGVDDVSLEAIPPQTGILLSCSPGEFSFEHKTLGSGHGAFFFHVIEALKGAARDPDDGEITWNGLRNYVEKKVPATVTRLYGNDGGEQNPNEFGNLRGRPAVLAIARIEPKPEPARPMKKNAEASPETPGAFAGTFTGQTRKDNSFKTMLVWIPPGDFTMGSPKDEKDRSDDEDHVQVTLTKGFWLGQHEVTQAEWRRVMQTAPWSGEQFVKEGDNYPATYVSWDDAMKFCAKLSEQERSAGWLPADWQYTLPTEAQWEYACRGGTKSRFSFGDDDSDLGEYAWFAKNADDAGDKYAHTVAQRKPNPWGLSDMHGNVWEWCRDGYGKQLSGGTDPGGATGGSLRVLRGGCWNFTARNCRSANRSYFDPAHRYANLGFRLAAVPSGK